MMPSQKFGVEMPNSAKHVGAQSRPVAPTADTMPAGTPISSAIRKAMHRELEA